MNTYFRFEQPWFLLLAARTVTALTHGTFLPRVAVPAQPGPAPSAQAATSSPHRVP